MTHFQTDPFRHFYDHEKIQELVITFNWKHKFGFKYL